jgi:hypothetical protein
MAMRILLLALMVCNIHCMSVQKKGSIACIQDQITRLEQASTDYNKQRTAHGIAPEGTDAQFVVTDEDCKAKITYMKESDGPRVEMISITLEVPTSVAALTEAFGKFKPLPPTPAGKWATIARHETGNAAQTYAIIGESRQKITDKTLISRVAIRIDYED